MKIVDGATRKRSIACWRGADADDRRSTARPRIVDDVRTAAIARWRFASGSTVSPVRSR
jgi:hypothetical protein